MEIPCHGIHADTRDYAGCLIGQTLHLDGVPFRIEGIFVGTATLQIETVSDAEIISRDLGSNALSIRRTSDCVRGKTNIVAYARMEVLVSSFRFLK